MAKKILLVSLMVLLGSTSAWASLVTGVADLPTGSYNIIDFQSQTISTHVLGTSLAITSGTNTVTFTGEDGQFRIDNSFAGSYNTTGHYMDNGPYTDPCVGKNNDGTLYASGPGFNTLKIDFSSPVKAFGFNMGAIDNYWTLAAYNAQGGLIEIDKFTPPGKAFDWPTYAPNYNTGEFYGIKSNSSNISYVYLTNTQQTLNIPSDQCANYGAQQGIDWVFIDNFRSSDPGSPPSVPIPSTALLLGSGLVALVGLRKKFFG